jgi:hypothetical protein
MLVNARGGDDRRCHHEQAAVFGVASTMCHRAMAEDRPDVKHLTEFYLWMSVGGVLGGIANALVAPVVFDRVLEYPIVLALVVIAEQAAVAAGLALRISILKRGLGRW